MDKNPVTEIHRHVYVEGGPQAIRVIPGPDGYGIHISTTHDQVSKDWFGSIDLTFSNEVAEALGRALIAASKDQT